MKTQKQEPIEYICYLFLEMAVSDGEASEGEIETLLK